jgi:N-methylhydantoinase B
MHGPMLYLYRSFFADSAGDGAWRGGRAAGLAFTPHGVERLRCTLTTQGLEVPVSPGLFGGLPGRCNQHFVIRQTRLPEMMAAGELGLELGDLGTVTLDGLGGRIERLPAKVELELHPGDVLQYSWSGGGGFGDPMERPLELIADDLRRGVISERRAWDAYGAVCDSAGSIDAAASERRRAELRRGRTRAVAGATIPFGPSMRIAQTSDGLAVQCRCGTPLGSAAANWKLGAARRALGPEELPDGIRLHQELELLAFSCPTCGALLSVEVSERGSEPLADLVLHSRSVVGSEHA